MSDWKRANKQYENCDLYVQAIEQCILYIIINCYAIGNCNKAF